MTANRRIVLNFIATYGRSLFALVCGLFTGRWLLMGLGEVDYGLLGVVGGLVGFIDFFNNLMATSVSRYYAFNVGKAKVALCAADGIELCRKWFTTAVVVHTVIPVVLVIIGYPLGLWAVEHFLAIPPNRIQACIWVWRFSCVACFVTMASVPFSAMYTAKQEIAELTIYSFIQTLVNFFFMYYVVTHPGDWLTRYSAWNCLIMVSPKIVLCARAVIVYPECRFRFAYVKSLDRLKELFAFASLRFIGAIAGLVQAQGMAIITNKFLGAARNASMTIGNSLASQSETLASALDGALSPAVTNMAGSGDLHKMRSLCFRACKFSTMLMLIFAIPLSLEVNEVMRLWLVNPPKYAADLCVFLIACLVLEKIACGHWMAIFSLGKIGWYQFWIGMAGLVALPIAWILIGFKLDLISIGIAIIVSKILYVVIRLLIGRSLASLSIRYWLTNVALPILLVTFCATVLGSFSCILLQPSFARIILTTGLVESVFLPGCWFVVLSKEERSYVWNELMRKIRK